MYSNLGLNHGWFGFSKLELGKIAKVVILQLAIILVYHHLYTMKMSPALKLLTPQEDMRILDLENFKWILRNKDHCKLECLNYTESGVRVMPILVHSARNHFIERHAIRSTFGNIVYRGWITCVVFLLGISGNSSKTSVNESQQIQEEYLRYGDIVMGNFVDAYHNMTYKALMGYKWVLNFCPKATFVMKIDDQVVVDVTKWIDWRILDLELLQDWRNERVKIVQNFREYEDLEDLRVIKLSSSLAKLSPPTSMYCLQTPARPVPFRNPKDKYYISKDEWPGDYFPPFCTGATWGITVDLMRKIYAAHFVETRWVWADDLFMNGILMQTVQRMFNFAFLPNIRNIRPFMTGFNSWRHKNYCLNLRPTNHTVLLERTNNELPILVFSEINRDPRLESTFKCLWNVILSGATHKVLVLGPYRNQTDNGQNNNNSEF